MTDQEFATFAKRLFVAFPSLWNWLQDNSPDPAETQRIWRQTLKPFTIDEALAVVESWATGKLEPFEAWERDKVHLIVRSIISAARDRRAKQAAKQDEQAAYRNVKRGVFDITARMDSSMVAALEDLRPEWKRYKDGELSRTEYDALKAEAFWRHGI